MDKKRVLIVDDEMNIRRILQAAFDKQGWHALIAQDGREALKLLEEQTVDCVLTDVTMPGLTGYELQAEIKNRHPEVPVVIMTAYGTIPQAVAAIRNGAFEYMTKPFDLDALKKVISSAMSSNSTPAVVKSKRPKTASNVSFIAESPIMKEIEELALQVADSRSTVLITGESGTGKEVIAKLIHANSNRAEKSFVAISCAALPETLLEAELFGHEKGAFTGADHAKAGRFELANNGTLFLDEIGDVPLPIQIKLLRVLQEREFERLGSTKPTKVDVRLVAATNRSLEHMVEEGTFRLDLLYRLQVVEIVLPPLRKRPEDIPLLAAHFLRKSSEENSRQLRDISAEAHDALLAYDWPGNVRELENTMERAAVLAKPNEFELLVKHLPMKMRVAA